MTIDTFKLLAKYNSFANAGMNKVVSRLTPAEWERDFGGYYKTVKALCAHIYVSDFNWLKRFGSFRKFSHANNPIFNDPLDFKSRPFGTVEEYLGKRQEADLMIGSLVDELMQTDLNEMLVYKNLKKQEQKRKVDGILLHIFNHQTHHRGMISLYLELLGKPNDFSSLFHLV